jgi:hypothetical protein
MIAKEEEAKLCEVIQNLNIGVHFMTSGRIDLKIIKMK